MVVVKEWQITDGDIRRAIDRAEGILAYREPTRGEYQFLLAVLKATNARYVDLRDKAERAALATVRTEARA